MSLDFILSFLKQKKEVIKKQFGISHIFIFGSHVNQKATENSDIDIAIQAPKSCKTFRNYLDLKTYLSSGLQSKVDLVYLDSMNPIIKASFTENHIEIK